ncbi:MAG: hydroxymethylglutaryl-CoA lyase [Phycisphaerales bacterium]|jgi:hydroxymethylglutaryl-CoA lyase|nr:hydroxymethylglutaryl-CoA lyase [Phycisphaerales bacterium]
MHVPTSIEITEVGPRDGLQNQKTIVDARLKTALVDALSKTGLGRIEVSSFVNPQWVPQLADSSEVFEAIERVEHVCYSALVPNKQGWLQAEKSGVDEIALVTSASESFCEKNINTSIAGSIERMKPIVDEAKSKGIGIRGYVSCVIACPYEGAVMPNQVRDVVAPLLDLGVEDISLGETIGVAVPLDIQKLYGGLEGVLKPEDSVLHLHDTRGTALANAFAAMQLGVRRFDTSCGGLGGCPYAPGSAGNLATEDLVYFASKMGIETGVDLQLLFDAIKIIEGALDAPLSSRTYLSSKSQESSN